MLEAILLKIFRAATMSNIDSLYKKAQKHLRSSQLQEAEFTLLSLLQEKPDHADAWIDLGKLRFHQKDFVGALEANEQALIVNPNNHEALVRTGLALMELNMDGSAIDFLETAATINPTQNVLENLGVAHYRVANFDCAAACFNEVLKINPKNKQAIELITLSFERMGNSAQALELSWQQYKSNPKDLDVQRNMITYLQNLSIKNFNANIKEIITTCLSLDNMSHKMLSRIWIGSYELDPAFQALRDISPDSDLRSIFPVLHDEFLRLGIERLPITKASIEKNITTLRYLLIKEHETIESWPKPTLDFLASMVIGAWYSEYVNSFSAEEQTWLISLKQKLSTINPEYGLDQTQQMMVMLVGCYEPLENALNHKMAAALQRSKSDAVKTVYGLQILEPAEERAIKGQIISFSDIEDDISTAVRAQYEVRPYPRWKTYFPETSNQALIQISEGLEILNAGCGTGQEAMKYQTTLPKARVTAIDLSKSSIAYATRMSRKYLKKSKITFKHGDILEAHKLNQAFDIISSSGVLHHMKDPEAGLKSLLGILKPGGRIHIEMYSRPAREQVLRPAWNYIKEKGYTRAEQDVRQLRDDIIAMPEGHPCREVLNLGDFYQLSECVDLLFHVNEHTYDLTNMEDMFQRHGLTLIRLTFPALFRAAYLENYPQDPGFENISTIKDFEKKYPLTFLEMYKFWLRRTDEPDDHPIDTLIHRDII